MRSKTIFILAAIAFLTVFVSACAAVTRHHNSWMRAEGTRPGARSTDSDQISGEWEVSFFVHGHTTPATFTFKLEGQKLTGTAYSDHTGAGTIRDGKFADGKLSFTLDFKKHESIAIAGALGDGKLAGEFTTEGFTAKWEAVKKQPQKA